MPTSGRPNRWNVNRPGDLRRNKCSWISFLCPGSFDLDPQNGLSSLAYEFALDDMTEVLAGLRARHGSPLSTSVEAGDRNDQIWVWNTGDDLITAVKRNAARQQQFLVSYRPSRLRPETL